MTQLTYDFELPIIGSDNDLWGDKLNDNWTLLDGLLDGTNGVSGIDINGGSIDGTPIGAASTSTGAFTTISASGDITGNVKGDIKATDGTVVLNNGTDGTDATFTGTASSLLNCTATGAELSTLASSNMTAAKMANLADLTVAEVDILDGATITTDELNYLANATSEVQAQIDGKQATLTAGTNIDIESDSTIHASGCPDVIVDGTTTTSGGDLVRTGFNIPVSNIILDQTGSATITSDVITLPAGTYLYEGTAMLRNTDSGDDISFATLQLVTDRGTGIGTAARSYMGERVSTNFSVIGTFTTAGDGFRLKATSSSSGGAIRYGVVSDTVIRQASTIKFWKIR